MALAIVQHPETSVGQKAGAGLYIAGETIAHGALAVGTAGVACGLLAPCAATAETLLGIGTAACADGDCTNEVTAASNTAQSIWNLSPFNRGLEVERLLGENLVRNLSSG